MNRFTPSALILLSLFVAILTGCSKGQSTPIPQPMPVTLAPRTTNAPRSKEARLVEVEDERNWIVDATGIGGDFDEAALDARRAGVYFMLHSGSAPLLLDWNARECFEAVKEDCYSEEQVSHFVRKGTFPRRRVRTRDGVQVTVQLWLDRERLRQYLSDAGCLTFSELDIPLPSVMVLPKVGTDEDPIAVLNENPSLRTAATEIESFLTARGYDAVVPEQTQNLREIIDKQRVLTRQKQDIIYQLALLVVGCDVYITYTVQLEEVETLNTKELQASVSFQAFETSTGQLLGTDIGNSMGIEASSAELIEKAVNDAIDKVLSRMLRYWRKDWQKGIQYKMLFSINEKFNRQERDQIGFIVQDLVAEFSNDYKEDAATGYTLDYRVWLKHEQFKTSRDFYRELQNRFTSKFADGQILQINLNRKLLLLEIVPKI
jgi:hypothetical protein